MKVNRNIIEIDESKCDGCGQCVLACAEGAIEIIDGKAQVVKDEFCDGLGACLGECPQDALKIIQREADEFNAEAVEAHLEKKSMQTSVNDNESLACGCPSAQIQSFGHSAHKNNVRCQTQPHSNLANWPVKIKLIPSNAPFLKNANLLVVADCVPLTLPSLNETYLDGNVVMIGCPKFDNREEYVDKFVEIFNTAQIKHITILYMEVPCCSGLPIIIEKAMHISEKNIPVKQQVIGIKS
jgi:NAD-dependent dihydropyrimidine dehydrogenase PreA subunit